MNNAQTIGPLKQLVLQPTPFCNLDCSYCYLPDRNNRHRMKVETAIQAHRWAIDSGILSEECEVRWHAGEPLATPIMFYQSVIEERKSFVPPGTSFQDSMQTNATLLTDEWCSFFKEYNIQVGVSIDGPDFIHDKYRKSRSGRPTHKSAVEGIQKLQRNDVPFSIIAVLTGQSFEYAEEIFEELSKYAPTEIGFNIEEIEGINRSSSVQLSDCENSVLKFLAEISQLSKRKKVICRELDEIRKLILSDEKIRGNPMNIPFYIVTVGWNGDFATFSPELLGYSDAELGSFTLGNIFDVSLNEAIKSKPFQQLDSKIQLGVRRCQKDCQYFTVCGGGSPGNKYFENHDFGTTATQYCRFRYQLVTQLLLDEIENELSTSETKIS